MLNKLVYSLKFLTIKENWWTYDWYFQKKFLWDV